MALAYSGERDHSLVGYGNASKCQLNNCINFAQFSQGGFCNTHFEQFGGDCIFRQRAWHADILLAPNILPKSDIRSGWHFDPNFPGLQIPPEFQVSRREIEIGDRVISRTQCGGWLRSSPARAAKISQHFVVIHFSCADVYKVSKMDLVLIERITVTSEEERKLAVGSVIVHTSPQDTNSTHCVFSGCTGFGNAAVAGYCIIHYGIVSAADHYSRVVAGKVKDCPNWGGSHGEPSCPGLQFPHGYRVSRRPLEIGDIVIAGNNIKGIPENCPMILGGLWLRQALIYLRDKAFIVSRFAIVGIEPDVFDEEKSNKLTVAERSDKPLAIPEEDGGFAREAFEALYASVAFADKDLGDRLESKAELRAAPPAIRAVVKDVIALAATSACSCGRNTSALLSTFVHLYQDMLNSSENAYATLQLIAQCHVGDPIRATTLFQIVQSNCIRVATVVQHIIDCKFDINDVPTEFENCSWDQPVEAKGPTNNLSHLDYLCVCGVALDDKFHTHFLDLFQDLGDYHRGPLKSKQRCGAKIVTDYTNNINFPRQPESMYMKDILRCTLVCPHVDDISKAVARLERCTGLKDRLQGPTHDVLVNIFFEGLVCEIQFHLSDFYKLKQFAHGAYEVNRAKGYLELLDQDGRLALKPFKLDA